jgi:hypothetical protein
MRPHGFLTGIRTLGSFKTPFHTWLFPEASSSVEGLNFRPFARREGVGVNLPKAALQGQQQQGQPGDVRIHRIHIHL